MAAVTQGELGPQLEHVSKDMRLSANQKDELATFIKAKEHNFSTNFNRSHHANVGEGRMTFGEALDVARRQDFREIIGEISRVTEIEISDADLVALSEQRNINYDNILRITLDFLAKS